MRNLETAQLVQKREFVAKVCEEFMTVADVQPGRHNVCPDCFMELGKSNASFTVP
jgi:hypothetical protein